MCALETTKCTVKNPWIKSRKSSANCLQNEFWIGKNSVLNKVCKVPSRISRTDKFLANLRNQNCKIGSFWKSEEVWNNFDKARLKSMKFILKNTRQASQDQESTYEIIPQRKPQARFFLFHSFITAAKHYFCNQLNSSGL